MTKQMDDEPLTPELQQYLDALANDGPQFGTVLGVRVKVEMSVAQTVTNREREKLRFYPGIRL